LVDRMPEAFAWRIRLGLVATRKTRKIGYWGLTNDSS
jgi:hypothetical protein